MEQRQIAAGQRWASEAEPELGLGIVSALQTGRVEIWFPAADETRLYALGNAPLRRVRFGPGDRVEMDGGRKCRVEAVKEQDGVCIYVTDAGTFPESNLAAAIGFSSADERLLAAVVDPLETFRRRTEALRLRGDILSSPTRGFEGARIDLLPHQLATAAEVASRPLPRVLLADEVGLGKTIEACLIAHRLIRVGRVSRVLVIVPEVLIHQWFVELLRRFNLMFSLYDAERWPSLRGHGNPFLDAEWVLISEEFLVSEAEISVQAVAAGWDLLIVDEAHHLEWHPDTPSPAYLAVEKLARGTPGVLLLTATPEQLGQAGHFARLRLLDPDRYSDLEAFRSEAKGYRAVAKALEALERHPQPTISRKVFEAIAGHLPPASAILGEWKERRGRPVAEVMDRLIDVGGPGRVWFRTTRAQLSGFPPRRLIPHPLEDADHPQKVRVRWLADLITTRLAGQKLLLITRSPADVEALARNLGDLVNVPTATFHERMTLLQRDRNAAYFAEPDGARLLLCSEIGSEGRNFQFAHHLVLWDLPEEPELLEQRIGRLDRIGQLNPVSIHVPYRPGTREEAWLKWYHEGLDAFERSLPTGHGFGERFGSRLREVPEPLDEDTHRLVQEARAATGLFRKQLGDGRDRLLGLTSRARQTAEGLIRQIRQTEKSRERRELTLDLFDACGLVVEPLSETRVKIASGPLSAEGLPGLPEEGVVMTFSRQDALAREDLAFLTTDHPFVEAAIDRLLGSTGGNSALALHESSNGPGLFIEAWFVIESLAPRALHSERFLSPAPLRVCVDHTGDRIDPEWDESELLPDDGGDVIEQPLVRCELLPMMIERAAGHAEACAQARSREAMENVRRLLGAEIERLSLLAERGAHVRPDEIHRMEREQQALLEALASTRPRLDAVRLIRRLG